MISYDLPVSKPDFADVLQKNIDRWYESAEDFARKVRAATGTTLSASSVSRWCNRQSTPTVANIETMAPFIFDDRKRPIPVRRLVALVYPALAGGSPDSALDVKGFHWRAVEIDRMLAEGSLIPPEKLAALESLLESVVAPYRTYLRRRKTG